LAAVVVLLAAHQVLRAVRADQVVAEHLQAVRGAAVHLVKATLVALALAVINLLEEVAAALLVLITEVLVQPHQLQVLL
jgi:hypothetical protein